MSTSFVMPGINQNDILQYVEDSTCLYLSGYSKNVRAHVISVKNDKLSRRYAMNKSAALSKFTGRKLDDFDIAEKASVLLLNTEDAENAWFIGYSTTVSNPEVVLNIISDILGKQFYSEHDSEYQDIVAADAPFEESLRRSFL